MDTLSTGDQTSCEQKKSKKFKADSSAVCNALAMSATFFA